MQRALVSWSSGKDAALALSLSLSNPHLEIVGLFTTTTEESGCIGIHEVPISLVEAQAQALGLPLYLCLLPVDCPNTEYEARLIVELTRFRDLGINKVIFGDLFLEDIRSYREKLLNRVGLGCDFPLWERKTQELTTEIINSKIKALITTVDSKKLSESFLGREFDENFVKDLPVGVDPCGENGEFHTYVYDAPGFRHPISLKKGPIFTHHTHLKSITLSKG